MAADPFPTWRSGRAHPRSLLVTTRFLALVGVLFACFILADVLVPIAQGGEARFTVNGEARVATRDDPWPALPVVAFALVLLTLLGGTALLVERENRRGPATWTATPEGLVRRRGDEVRTLPWRLFSRAEAVRTSRERGHVHLWRTRFGIIVNPGWHRANEGLVWSFHRALIIPDVEDPQAVAAHIQARLR